MEEEREAVTPIKVTPLLSSKPITSPIPNNNNKITVSQSSSCQPDDISPAKQKIIPPKDYIQSIARKISSEPLQNSVPGAWAALTAISENARKRKGMHIFLTGDEHCIGRVVEDVQFRIESSAVSGRHCQIYKERSVIGENGSSGICNSVFLKDTSTNGTYLNWEKLKKNVSGAKLQHGDIVSLAAAPHSGVAFAFVYREVLSAALKRKADEYVSENKRPKGIGIGAPEGPISLDDVRSLQRSNMELRKQLESHIHTIETLRSENREAVGRHENELKGLKESVSESYLNEIKELNQKLEVKQNELVQITAVSAERQQAIVDLNEQLSASMQSRTDADVIINSQKASISEHEKQLDEERNQRREEREKALADQKAALQRAHLEAQEELKRQSDNASRQEREFKEVINKLQDSDRESRQLVETLRSKLEDSRESLVKSEQKVRQLETQVLELQQLSAKSRKKIEALESEMKKLRKELENEKVAREEAWAKVSALELEMAAAIRELSVEKQKFQGARERIILRETQLRQFYSTTEEITDLFTKQKEQLKAMQRALEDEENYDNIPFDIDENVTLMDRAKHIATPNNLRGESSAAPNPIRVDSTQAESTSNEGSDTEKHECDVRNREEDDHHTQDLECTSADRGVNGAFGSDINGVGTAPVLDGEGEGDPVETERVLETESEGVRNIDLNKTSSVPCGGDTMQLDEENGDTPRLIEDTEGTRTFQTADLLTSEVAGSWAIDTAPSVHGENGSPRETPDNGPENNGEDAAGSQVAASRSTTKLSQELKALNEMIEIVAPGQFGGGASSKGRDDEERGSSSNSDTEGASDNDDVNEVVAVGRSISDEEDTQEGSDVGEADNDDVMEDCDDDDEREEDSLG
ncbi:hypothetical protein ACHQM5_001098 [Ranunculus cassubicifolius]